MRSFDRRSVFGVFVFVSMLAASGTLRAQDAVTPDYAAVIAAPDRSDADRQTDQRRQPAKMLAFTGARPGMKVLDMGAGAGYSTELLARAVGSGGSGVHAQESAGVMERANGNLRLTDRGVMISNEIFEEFVTG